MAWGWSPLGLNGAFRSNIGCAEKVQRSEPHSLSHRRIIAKASGGGSNLDAGIQARSQARVVRGRLTRSRFVLVLLSSDRRLVAIQVTDKLAHLMINLKPGSKRDSQTELMTYPAWGYQLESGNWRVNLSGVAWLSPVVFTRRQKMMIRMLGNVMKASPEEMACEVFNDRITPFMAEADKRRKITATIGGQEFSLRKKTRGNGHFRNWLIVPSELIQRAQDEVDAAPGSQLLPIALSIDGEDASDVVNARLLPHRGVSVVSDIDDTVKDSAVGDRRELLNNTFIREFRLVDGMADAYRTWAAAGAEFHYVSSSPWQLFEPLMELQTSFDLPGGTMHLRNFRLRDQLFQKLIIRRQGKRHAIQKLFKCFPERDFVLVGDSGEKDPEIYLKICKRFPGRVKGLFIRDLEHRPMDDELFGTIKLAMSGNACSRFSSGDDLLGLGLELCQSGQR